MSLASIYTARGKHEMAEPLLQKVVEWRVPWTRSHGSRVQPRRESSVTCIPTRALADFQMAELLGSDLEMLSQRGLLRWSDPQRPRWCWGV